MKSVGIVLSGGGARGAAHLGVLQALGELNVKVAAVSGVSAGAIIGALYTAGHAPLDILAALKGRSYFGLSDIAWLKPGIFSAASLRKALSELIGADDFGQLKIPLFVTATDMVSQKSITFSSGKLFDVVIGSSSVPLVFQSVMFEQYELLDGGMLNNFPVEPLIGNVDVIIGSHVNKLRDASDKLKQGKVLVIDQCFHMVIAAGVQERASLCNIFIEPQLAGFGMFDIKRADQLFELGYAAAMEQKHRLLKLTSSEILQPAQPA